MGYCFEEAAFEADDFHPATFLEECQSRSPIVQVHHDLENFMQSLENQLVAIIDKDYAEFLQLSVKLKGVNSAVLSLRSPLLHILERVHAVKAAAHTLVHKAEAHVAQLAQLQTHKANLQLSITIAEKFHSVESLLGIASISHAANAEVDVPFISAEQSTLLERAARLVLELGSLLAQGVDVPTISAEEPRLALVERTLRQRLEAELATEIVPDSFYAREHVINTTNVNHLLRAYVLLQEASIAEAMVARLVMQPFLDETMTRGRLDGRHRGSCEGLSGIYAAVLQYVERKLGAVLVLPVCQGGNPSTSVDLLGHSIWTPVVDTMRAKLGEVFTPANPDRFHHNFTTSMSFATSLEQLCATPVAAQRFRTTHVQPFRDSWNLVVYLQLRQNELNQALAVSKSTMRSLDSFVPPTTSDSHSSSFAFPVTTATWQVLVKTWSDGVVLAPLVAASARYSLTVLSQYASYWRDPLEKALALVKSAQGNAKTMSLTEVHHAGLSTCDDVFCLGSDLHRLGLQVKRDLVGMIASKVPREALASDEAATEFARKLVDEPMQALELLERMCWDVAVIVVSEECKKVLPAVRTIKGQYQMTNKPMPTTPSSYVATVTRPLHAFLDKWRDSLGAYAMSADVLSTTMEMYASLASELLKSATELEESLKSRKNQRLMVRRYAR
ncbi:hypothetical protein, variant 2 [Aphanomyces invadans]|uniref:Conserved oligomeric Golgi complex subunit 2 n=1 Tax=Aphanomyces invadans TaxID=157072 RepID=A0A024TPG4_9STRA|nr:hypothetical protein, variant 1 [Aphanomyces invadans]XP_008875724.1 hypothetical protein, variant 2 [Aphanomyces invadans]ETV95516.1 hypothetical protein, variant 1 [Aphanomyces invadans]ETV95517.1 hypothetical protein, variant 2 [Aphanomyces invadans]|eukprot:XP_008875717.1 hypothetical protein, variant 1 [Aphanomyces invadans]